MHGTIGARRYGDKEPKKREDIYSQVKVKVEMFRTTVSVKTVGAQERKQGIMVET